ncbi:hypothetical protein NDU88_003253 [Pleurodeles waltl]|uniref:Uncharacterized protein n=1 Tax=Pleurodeles waltl TaxID=8319 RepID=A0AAV7UBL1_PLEWA|nr:hypothetical protein NDU88_003253 [Pleurodeles waltl]
MKGAHHNKRPRTRRSSKKRAVIGLTGQDEPSGCLDPIPMQQFGRRVALFSPFLFISLKEAGQIVKAALDVSLICEDR